MSLMDTADGIFMTNAYHWAFSTPLRKVYYNLTVTALSVTAALLIGMIELAQVISEKLGFSRGIWRWIQNLDIPGQYRVKRRKKSPSPTRKSISCFSSALICFILVNKYDLFLH
jgi:High-affinity nickel-transport protein